MSEEQLKDKDYEELTQGIKNAGELLREFPDGLKGLINRAKEKAKSQVEDDLDRLFTPIKNTLTDLENKLKQWTGIDGVMNRIENKTLQFINAFARFITKFLLLTGAIDKGNDSYQNLLAWMRLLGNPFNYGRIGWGWGILLPPGLPVSGPIIIRED